jgi:hypothetical protein
VYITAPRPLQDHDPVVIELLRLAAETILAHPEAVPPGLHDLCDAWADNLACVLGTHLAPAPGAARPPATDSLRHKSLDALTQTQAQVRTLTGDHGPVLPRVLAAALREFDTELALAISRHPETPGEPAPGT